MHVNWISVLPKCRNDASKSRLTLLKFNKAHDFWTPRIGGQSWIVLQHAKFQICMPHAYLKVIP